MATIKDIAKKAGVAQGTVSNVLNGKGNVSSDKIRRVLEPMTVWPWSCLIHGPGSMRIFISSLKIMPRNMVIWYHVT